MQVASMQNACCVISYMAGKTEMTPSAVDGYP